MEVSTDFKVVCLQRYPEYYEQTITLLNNQWPRSRTARMRSLEQGFSDRLPTSLVLLQKQDNGRETIVAHSKISPVPYKLHLCFVESVVVEPGLRGKGIGRLIMEHTEHYVKSLGITTVYLTTFDQQGFYSKLGYELCEPIVVFGGGALKLAEKADNFKLLSHSHPSAASDNHSTKEGANTNAKSTIQLTETHFLSNNANNVTVEPQQGPPPPPPPPPPPLPNQIGNNNITQVPTKVTMRKVLCEN